MSDDAKNDHYTQLLDTANADLKLPGIPASSQKLPTSGKEYKDVPGPGMSQKQVQVASLKTGDLGPACQGLQSGSRSRRFSIDETKKLGSKQFSSGAKTVSRRLSLPPLSSASGLLKLEICSNRFARVTSL